MRVLVTGSASRLARVLLPLLCAEERISHIIGVDLRASGFVHRRFSEHHLDVRASALHRLFTGVDALIHMAFIVMRGDLVRQRRDRLLMRSINVNGSINVFRAAMAEAVPRVIHVSSAAVYGAWPDNPTYLDEVRPLRAMSGFAYAEDKVTVETWLDQYQQAAGAPRVTRLRPHAILGPHCQPLLRFLLRQPFYPRLPDPQPVTQCVWEDDVARAIVQGLFSNASGSFNLAAEPAMSFRAMQQFRHRRAFPLPFPLVRALQRALWHVAGLGGEPGWLQALPHSLALDCQRAHQYLGWRPQASVYDCLRQLPR
jgi:UDP-glucose 4-epimerase